MQLTRDTWFFIGKDTLGNKRHLAVNAGHEIGAFRPDGIEVTLYELAGGGVMFLMIDLLRAEDADAVIGILNGQTDFRWEKV